MAYRRPLQDLIDNAGAAEGADTGLTEYAEPRNGGNGGNGGGNGGNGGGNGGGATRGSLQPGQAMGRAGTYKGGEGSMHREPFARQPRFGPANGAENGAVGGAVNDGAGVNGGVNGGTPGAPAKSTRAARRQAFLNVRGGGAKKKAKKCPHCGTEAHPGKNKGGCSGGGKGGSTRTTKSSGGSGGDGGGKPILNKSEENREGWIRDRISSLTVQHRVKEVRRDETGGTGGERMRTERREKRREKRWEKRREKRWEKRWEIWQKRHTKHIPMLLFCVVCGVWWVVSVA